MTAPRFPFHYHIDVGILKYHFCKMVLLRFYYEPMFDSTKTRFDCLQSKPLSFPPKLRSSAYAACLISTSGTQLKAES